ncbi:porin family protein [Lutibacter sp. Hel_I_33_5]|uniref:porin family protein n=1 Tax=Lutibacter sp. Hel_I_33_5 TaxID=1566289 RepID=UPI002105DAE1|nr:porin family protein [Lutibacter sp. Hel_I_33_5]
MISLLSYSQKDSLQLGDRYADDQLYLSVTYNQLYSQPTGVKGSGFSYGFSGGILQDIILNKKGSFSVALGLGYNYDFLNQALKIEEINNTPTFSIDENLKLNEFRLHAIEFPVEFRLRTSDANKYKFWRLYAGVKFSYNLHNKFNFTDENDASFEFSNITGFNKFQYGITLSAGYDLVTFHVYYGLKPLFKNGFIGAESVNTKLLKMGLIFYIL